MDPWIGREALEALRAITREPGLTYADVAGSVGPHAANHALPYLERLGHIKRSAYRWYPDTPLPEPRAALERAEDGEPSEDAEAA